MKIKNKTKWLVYTALMTALTAVATMFVSIPSTGGGHTNLSDAIIFMTAVLMDPIAAMIAGGLGTFLADWITYPTTMFFSLAFHGVEGLVVGLLIRFIPRGKGKAQYALDAVYMVIGGILMIVGYYFAKAYAYGTPITALESLWRNMIQVAVSIAVAYLLLYPLKLTRLVNKDELYGKIKVSPTAAKEAAAATEALTEEEAASGEIASAAVAEATEEESKQ